MEDVTAPKCGVCNHHHVQNRPRMNVFTVQGYDCLQRNPSIHNLDKGLWTFTKILRGRIFPHTGELPTDPVSRHLIAYIGDAPIATARWRLVTEEGAQVVEIDLLGVLVDKRQKGFGKQLLQHILEDINTRLLELQASCSGLLAFIPESDATHIAIKLFEASGFHVEPQRHVRDGVKGFRMIMLSPM